MWFALISLLVIALAAFYYFVQQCHSYFEKKGIPHIKPTFFFGNMLQVILGKKHFGTAVTEAYKKFPNCKYIGFYKFLSRTIIVRDPDLIGDIMIKDFPHFSDNDLVVDKDVDYIMSKNIFVLKGHQWKTMRGLISPMFSSGKLKYIYPLVDEVSQRLTNYLNKEIDAGKGKLIDGKRLCQKFTIDNVASCAFGLNGKAFEGDSEFSVIVRDFNDLSYLNTMKFMLLFLFPSLHSVLKIRFFKEDVETYLTRVVSDTLRYRKENNEVRNDFLDNINALKEKSTDYVFTDRDVVAQGAGFFIDGVETSAGVLSHVLYDIARHPEVQKKLRAEIAEVKAKNNNKITYEAISNMTYLDCVLHETLRINGPVSQLLKVCTKTYTFPEISDTNKTRITIHPGDSIIIPMEGLHCDPNYFDDPEAYKPERFFEENKANQVKNTFIPFGNGPRFCIGMRFALLQIKVALVAIIGNFEVAINPEMLPYVVHPTSFMKAPLKGFKFDFTKLKA